MADLRLPEHPDQRLTRSVPCRSNDGSRRGADPHPLVEREAALRAVLSGPRQVVISGGLGCGRTALLHAALARSDALVLSATATRTERDVPFAVGSQLAPFVPRDRETVVAVDDVHHADAESVAFLVWLRRFPNVRVVVTHAATDSLHRVELSAWAQMWLRPLSPGGVAQVAGASGLHALSGGASGLHTPNGAAPELHALSGGNPALLSALLDDGAEVGPSTRRTFLDLLRREDPALFDVACALAVLGPRTSLLGALTDRHQDAATSLTAVLTESGLLDGHRFRLPGAASILLGALKPEHATALHRRAALLLHNAGAPDIDVAERCVAAGTVDDSVGGTAMLRRAAGSARPSLAVDCLRLALRQCGPGEAEAVRVELGRVQWLIDPAAAARTLLPCTSPDLSVLRARWWQGDFSQRLPDDRPAESSLCHEFFTGRPLSVPEPERVLQGQRHDSMPEALAQALRLVGPVRFEHWLTRVTGLAEQRGWVTLFALLDCVRAEKAWRRGDVGATAVAARSALDRLTADGWGVVIGFPLSFALLADAALGRETPPHQVPDAMCGTAFWPRYLRARGHHHLALGRPYAALDDFTACADRLGEAEARLALGQPRLARAVLDEEIRSVSDPRSLGVALRLLARVASRTDRLRLLRDSVRQLEKAGDHLELSRALADLGRDRSERGVLGEARLLARRARRVSGLPEHEPSQDVLTTAESGLREHEPVASQDVLTTAERRVARLAAAGHSNREIGRRLCVTVSTVEQHLTRIYRKLAVPGREDLPRGLITR